ncbi:hypothetical protein D3C86_1637000 [compost metagenome]
MRELEQLEQIARIFSGQGLNPFQAVLQRVAVDIQVISGMGDAAIMVNEASKRLNHIYGILQLGGGVQRGQGSVAQLHQKFHVFKSDDLCSRLQRQQNIHRGSGLAVAFGYARFLLAGGDQHLGLALQKLADQWSGIA